MSDIHIKPSKRGTFTAAAKKRGKSVQGFASQVLAHKENYSPAMIKKANFAKNASKWKHADGGELLPNDYYLNLFALGGETDLLTQAQKNYMPVMKAQPSQQFTGLQSNAPQPQLAQMNVGQLQSTGGGIGAAGYANVASTAIDILSDALTPNNTDPIGAGVNQTAGVDEENDWTPQYIDASQIKANTVKGSQIALQGLQQGNKGAQAGMAFGPVGAAVGGIVGTGASLMKNLFGNRKAKKKAKKLRNQARGLNSMATLESYMGKAYGFAEGGNLSNLMGRKYFAEGGLTTFNNGGSHEESPIGGIPQGMSETGQMNLVEEGETRFQDYIFSDRLLVHKEIAEQMNLPKKVIGKTFAEASGILGKDLEEHPNDPISERGFEEMMTRLMAANNMTKDLKDADEQANVFAEGGDLGDSNMPIGVVKESEEATEDMGRETKPITDEQVQRVASSNIKEEKIPGGRSNSEVREKATELFDPMEISIGIKVEMEHTDSIEAAREIALDHLVENNDYYTRLYHIGLIDEDLSEEEEQFLKDKWAQIEGAEELSPEEQSIDQPIDESALEQLNEALNEILMDQPQMEGQQFASGGFLDNNKRNGAYFRAGRWYMNPDSRLTNIARPTGSLGLNPNKGVWKTDSALPIPPERQLFTMPDITGGYNQSDPMFYLRNNERRTPSVIKGGEDEVSTTKTSTPTSRKTSISPIDAEGEFNRMMDKKYNFKNLTGLDYGGNDYFIPNASKDVTLSSNPRNPQAARIDIQDVDPILTPTSVGNEDYPGDWEDKLSLLQYAPVLGNLIGAATVGKAERINPARITPQQLNDYLQYNPIDPNTYMNPILAQAANARRAMADASGGSRASMLAANLGLNAQSQNAISQAALQAEAINEQRRLQSAEFNRGTNQFNASERARAEQFNTSAKMQADDINARNRAARRNAIRGYLTGAAQGLGGIGREQAYRNTIKTMGLDYYLDALSKVKYKKS